jgi:hypothetical protein
MLDTKRENVSGLISIGVAIYQATIDKDSVDEHEVKSVKKELYFLRNQMNYNKDPEM